MRWLFHAIEIQHDLNMLMCLDYIVNSAVYWIHSTSRWYCNISSVSMNHESRTLLLATLKTVCPTVSTIIAHWTIFTPKESFRSKRVNFHSFPWLWELEGKWCFTWSIGFPYASYRMRSWMAWFYRTYGFRGSRFGRFRAEGSCEVSG